MTHIEYIGKILDQYQSKENCNHIITYIGTDPKKMEGLMHFFFHDEWRYNQKAAWPLGHIGELHPHLVKPYLEKMVHNLDNAKHVAVIRNTLRIFEFVSIPEELEGLLLDKCFRYMSDTKEPIAIRVFSMTVLYVIAEKYPDLVPELMAEIHNHMPHGSPGFQSRGRKILAKLEKLIIEQNTGFG